MIDPTPTEKAAFQYAGEQAGEYLDSIGKTDLTELSADEWDTFCSVMCFGYVDHITSATLQFELQAKRLRTQIESLPE